MSVINKEQENLPLLDQVEVVAHPLGGFALTGVRMLGVYENRPGTVLTSPEGHPNIIARYGTRFPLSEKSTQQEEQLASAVIELSDEYGLNSPGIGNLVPIGHSDYPDIFSTFITASRIDGVNMRTGMSEIPPNVTLETIDNIIRYYEAAMNDNSDKLYLTDISLRQVIYGKINDSDSLSVSPKTYLFDIDPRLSNLRILDAHKEPEDVALDSAVYALIEDINMFEKTFPDHPVDEATKERLKNIARRLRAPLFGAWYSPAESKLLAKS